MFYENGFIQSAQRHPEVPRLTEDQLEAIEVFDGLASSDALRMDYVLQPGDIQLLHNHQIIHTRSEYVDFEVSLGALPMPDSGSRCVSFSEHCMCVSSLLDVSCVCMTHICCTICRSQRSGGICCACGCPQRTTGPCPRCFWSASPGPLSQAAAEASLCLAMSPRCHWKQSELLCTLATSEIETVQHCCNVRVSQLRRRSAS